MKNNPQFRVVPGTTGGATVAINPKGLKWLIAFLSTAPDGETAPKKKYREALLKELQTPKCEPRDIDLDPCS